MVPANQKILFIAYYFPPLGMGGTQRIAKWCKYLTRKNWQTSVVTVKPIAYYAYDESLLNELSDAKIIRTPSLDPARLFYLLKRKLSAQSQTSSPSKLGKLLYWFLIPDPKILWAPFAFWQAWREIRKKKISFVITTGPPHSSHLVGWWLSKLLNINWVCDFRDSWGQVDFLFAPTSFHRKIHRWLERKIVHRAHTVLAVSKGIANDLERVDQQYKKPIHFLPNGYDHEEFSGLEKNRSKCFEVTHVGAISRITNPQTLIAGFRSFIEYAQLSPNGARLNFIGADLTGKIKKWIRKFHLSEFVYCSGYLPHREAISYLSSATVLVFIASDDANPSHIPGKTFEYLAARKPILAVGKQIEGMKILIKHTTCRHCQFNSTDAISRALLSFYRETMVGLLPKIDTAPLEFSREQQTDRLIEILTQTKPN